MGAVAIKAFLSSVSMKLLFLDIETIPTTEALCRASHENRDPELDDSVIKKLSLGGVTGKILCLGYAVEPPYDTPIEMLSGNEPAIIKSFWELATNATLFVGHNILDFDLRFIYQRSIIHQIKPSRELPFSRFRSSPIFDTMHEWSKWGRQFVKLDVLAKCLDLPSPKTEMDASNVYEFYKTGRLNEIYEYCKRDVQTVREIYRRMTFTETGQGFVSETVDRSTKLDNL